MQKIQRSTLAVLLLVALLFSSVVPAFAQDVAPDKPGETNHLYLPTILATGAEDEVEAAGGFHWRHPRHKDDRTVTVMTRNLYLGADLEPLIRAALTPGTTPKQFFVAVGIVYGQARASDIPGRMRAVADEIAAVQPELIGLQEVTTWSTGPFTDPAQASQVQYDYLRLLLRALFVRGLIYEPVVIVTGFDAEAPAVLGTTEVLDVRLTVRDVLLARRGLSTADLKLSNPQGENYDARVELPTPVGTSIAFLRQWASVDVKIRGKSFRFITTHLESFNEQVRVAQAQELLAGPANTRLPTIVVGDFNSQPGVAGDAAANVIAAGFTDVWAAANGNAPGLTCCQDADLRNATTKVTERIDLILDRGGFGIKPGAAQLTGAAPIVLAKSDVRWASDHSGVFADLQVPK